MVYDIEMEPVLVLVDVTDAEMDTVSLPLVVAELVLLGVVVDEAEELVLPDPDAVML